MEEWKKNIKKKNPNGEILALLDKYGNDTKRALKENKKLEYLYALAPLRENLLEWYEFRKGGRLLQAGADFGALTGLYLRKTGSVTVLDESEESLEVVRRRYRGETGLRLECGSLTAYSRQKENSGSFDYVLLIGRPNGSEGLAHRLRRLNVFWRRAEPLFLPSATGSDSNISPVRREMR